MLKLAEYSREDVNEIVLVGGTTRMPKVREMVADYFDKEPNWSVDPDQAVAWGTAVQVCVCVFMCVYVCFFIFLHTCAFMCKYVCMCI